MPQSVSQSVLQRQELSEQEQSMSQTRQLLSFKHPQTKTGWTPGRTCSFPQFQNHSDHGAAKEETVRICRRLRIRHRNRDGNARTPKAQEQKEHFASYGAGKKLGKAPASPNKTELPATGRSTRSSSRQPRTRPPPPTPATSVPKSPAKSPTKSSAKSPVKPAVDAPVKSPAKKSQSPARTRGRPAAPPPATADQPKPTSRRVRTVSPAKRLIADSPPPEDRMNPFPPKPEPMTVTDKPAVRNRHGEKVVAPVDIKQKMRQAINFLSDDGVENLADFEEKLNRIEAWLDKNHPGMDGIIADGEDDTELLCRRVRYMIWVHKERIEEGAEQWFTRDQFPASQSMYKPIKPKKDDPWRLNPDYTTTGKPVNPKEQVMQAQDRDRFVKARAEKAAAAKASPKKAVASTTPTRPELPHPEIWHRKEAARFPYGETPYMEQVMSRQITADLARGREAKDALEGGNYYALKKVLGDIKNYILPPAPPAAPFDPWKLPEVAYEDVLDADQWMNVLSKEETTGSKRKAVPSRSRSPAKRNKKLTSVRAAMPEANTTHHILNATMSSEPSSPAFVNTTAPLHQEIKNLKGKLDEVNSNFAYYEESNERLEKQVADQSTQLDLKDSIISRLKEHIATHQKEHDETHQENVKLRRESLDLESLVKANEKELKSVVEMERTIEDREAEVRHYTAELTSTRTERDDKVTEVRGLEGDIARLHQELEVRDQEVEALQKRIEIYERHISISKDLPVEDLDDALYGFMEKWSAIQADGPSPPRKPKRTSIRGMNLADEFDALSDEDYDSEGGYGSDQRSIRSFDSLRPKKMDASVLAMSEIESVAIHPSVKKPVTMTSAGTQMCPKPVPQNASKGTQTTPVLSPKKTFSEVISSGVSTSPIAAPEKQKKSFSEVISNGVSTSPIAALIQKFTPAMVSSAAQTSPEPRKSFSEVLSGGVSTSPVDATPSPPKSFSEVMSDGISTSPIAASSTKTASSLEVFTFSDVASNRVQTSPVAPSPRTAIHSPKTTTIGVQTDLTIPSPLETFSEVISSGGGTSPITPPPQTVVSSPTSVPLPSSPSAKSPVSVKSPKSPLSKEVTEEQTDLADTLPPQPGKAARVNTLNIKRPRVPTKDMSPQTLQHYKAVTAPTTLNTDIPSTSSYPNEPQSPAHIITALIPFIQDLVAEILLHWRLILILYSAAYLGASSANTAVEWSWANANGYAPENKYLFVGKAMPGHVGAMVWGVVGWVWSLVFGHWGLGAVVRLPLSPG
ncbi:unnamed protein product [Aureobasidium uvarum]|uniref:Uncharacterized protein n=1 Tax=Aureobasidium uvarum TaxID=2773716 RepID=A0A9N8PUV7_9PEZI|nr:unnamed protein product [Aureobasidium uvarum]